MSFHSNLSIKTLTPEETREIYVNHAHKDFPPAELKPFSTIENLRKKGWYCCYGFFEKADKAESLCAYAFTMADNDVNMLLLDYFAVCEEYRGKGYGAAAFALLKENAAKWDGVIIEVEDDDMAEDAEEKRIRQKRIAFYEKNGAKMTGERSAAFGVDYKLMTFITGSGAAKGQIGAKLSSIYRKMLSEEVYRENFRLR